MTDAIDMDEVRETVESLVRRTIKATNAPWSTADIMRGMTAKDLVDFANADWRDVQRYVELFSGLNETPIPPALDPQQPSVPERASRIAGHCRHFQPDDINPTGGFGSCAAGHGILSQCEYPRVSVSCVYWLPVAVETTNTQSNPEVPARREIDSDAVRDHADGDVRAA